MIQNQNSRSPVRRNLPKKSRPRFRGGLLFLLLLAGSFFTASASDAKTTAKEKYVLAEKQLNRLMENPALQQYRDKWLKCIDQFYAVYESDPSDPYAPAGLFKAGSLYLDLSRISWLASDEAKAMNLFEKVIKEYPKSKYHLQAAKNLKKKTVREKFQPPPAGDPKTPRPKVAQEKTPAPAPLASPKTLRPKVGKKRTEPMTVPETPETSETPEAKTDDIETIISDKNSNDPSMNEPDEPSSAVNGKQAVVTSLRFWSNPSYTRVVVNTDGEPSYSHHMLKKDLSNNKPQRLFIDLANSKIAPQLNRQVPINDNLLENVRAGQFTPESTRVVIDIKSYDNYKVFTLRNPFRLVIDVWGKKGHAPKVLARPETTAPVSGTNTPLPQKVSKGSLAQQLALGVKTIVIDPGHGGKDYGAKGYLRGIHEKHITLALGLTLAKIIKEKLNCQVVMTRTTDRYIPLEERTAIANTKNADLFISIHTNAHREESAYGIETYFLNLATDEAAISVAARENATSTKNISDLQSILDSLMQNSKINESMRLAGFVQDSMTSKMKKKYDKINNKGVKQAPFYVLLGAQMPAILVETSFISNPRECNRLKDPKYQGEICEGIINGIRQYIQATNPTVLYHPVPPKKQRSRS